VRDILLISRAWHFAAQRHSTKRRKGKAQEPYVNHLAEVAELVATATEGQDANLVAAAVLHDTVEDTAIHACKKGGAPKRKGNARKLTEFFGAIRCSQRVGILSLANSQVQNCRLNTLSGINRPSNKLNIEFLGHFFSSIIV
jgi:hypothetical protein